MQGIYLDNAATSWPKPEAVAARMGEYLLRNGATINRSTYGAAYQAGLVTWTLRERLCALLHAPRPDHVVLTAGCTMALNMLLRGYLRPGDHCLVSAVEHNAVMRPLRQLEKAGVTFSCIPCDGEGFLDPAEISPLIRENTRLVLVNHASNVGGGVQDLEAIGAVCAARGIPFAADGAQTAGHWPIDFEKAQLSALAVPAHKGLLGPQGIGALLLGPGFAPGLSPLIAGGTGSASDSEEMPAYMPDRFEAGTANLPGIYGWEAAIAWIAERGVEALQEKECRLTARFLTELAELGGLRIAGPAGTERRTGVISVDFVGRDNAVCADLLETGHGILTRCGLHCAPAAHRTLGTFPGGAVRFSVGWASTEADVDAAVRAVRDVLRQVPPEKA